MDENIYSCVLKTGRNTVVVRVQVKGVECQGSLGAALLVNIWGCLVKITTSLGLVYSDNWTLVPNSCISDLSTSVILIQPFILFRKEIYSSSPSQSLTWYILFLAEFFSKNLVLLLKKKQNDDNLMV